jgi:hypothetical protein
MQEFQPFQNSMLQDIIEPLSMRAFVEEYWGRAPLFIRGRSNKFSTLLSRDRLWDSLRSLGQNNETYSSDPKFRGFYVIASFDRGQTTIPVPPFEASRFFAAGATLCINNVNLVDFVLQDTIDRLQKEMRFAGKISFRAYLSPAGQGFGWQFDARVATTLQIEGSKEWKFSKEAAVIWPTENRQLGPPDGALADTEAPCKSPAECSIETVTLRPGDLLCLPAGHWHTAAASEYSLALNLAFDPIGGLWPAFEGALKHLIRLYPGWRAPLPLTYGAGENADRAPIRIHEFYRDRGEKPLRTSGKSRSLTGVFMGFRGPKAHSNRIDELIGVIQLLRESPEVLDEAWGKLHATNFGAD